MEAFIQSIFEVNTFSKGKVLLVAENKFTHRIVSPAITDRRNNNYSTGV